VAPKPDDQQRQAEAEGEAQADKGKEAEPPKGRLPQDVQPQKYTLAITIDPTKERFGGKAIIDVEMDKPRKRIWMHGRNLKVSEATVRSGDRAPMKAKWEQVTDQGVASLTVPEQVGPGEVEISISYSASFNDDLNGLYKVEEGKESYAFTQFEATSARKAFPSFDEPSFKTPFDVTLIVQKDHVAAGNTPVAEKEVLDGGLKRVRYETTKPMPTYLLAWAVGPLDVVEAEDIPSNKWRDRKIPFRGLTVKGKGDKMAYALEHHPEILEELEKYFADGYPYDKLDIVAVPDFGAGAMENVGLTTYREQFILVEEDGPEWQRRVFAGIVAHELAHQWFGNMVTMPWWNDIWLNEAFATWMGHKVVSRLYPEYKAQLSLLKSVQEAMEHDSLTSARQIRQPIESNHDIRNAFDSITYQKGAGVLQMFEKWIGEETFRDGLREYMRKHAWGTATAGDLLSALSEASGQNVTKPFKTFLMQPGLPFADVKTKCENGSAELTVEQSRYLPVGSEGDADKSWDFPMCVRYGAKGETQTSCKLVTSKQATVSLDTDSCPSWVMPNADGAGYYRFALPQKELNALMDSGWGTLGAREKLALADAVRAGFNNASIESKAVYGTLGKFAGSGIRHVEKIPMKLLKFKRDYLAPARGDKSGKQVLQRGRKLFRPAFRELGWNSSKGEKSETKLRRAAVIQFLALSMEDPRVRRKAERLGRRYVSYPGDIEIQKDAVDSNLVDTVLSVAVQEGEAEFFDALEKKLFETEDALLRGQLLRALGHAKDDELASRARALALDERLRRNEIFKPLSAQMGQAATREATWKWMKDHFEALSKRMSKGHVAYLPYLADGFCSENKASEVKSFFEGKIEEYPGGPRNLRSALETIRLCAARVSAHK
jgi:alanyl aminopeptidase